jgi:Lar family restriction alleviation protein
VGADMNELKLCPFCGLPPIMFNYEHEDKKTEKIHCGRCFFSMEFTDFINRFNPEKSEKSLVTRWNRRSFEKDFYLVRIDREGLDCMNTPIDD